jgi:hypothetical protein
MVRLPELKVKAMALGGVAAKHLDVLEGRSPIDLRLARAQEVEIGAVENVSGLRHGKVRGRGARLTAL